MEILGVSIDKGKFIKLYAKINPLKKEIKIVKDLKSPKIVVSIPIKDSTFRVFQFDFDDESKINKAVETYLKIEFSDYENIEWSLYKKGKTIFCVITKKEIVSNLKKEFKDIYSIDSDVFALIRLLKHSGIKTAKIIHFYEEYAFFMDVENLFPKIIQTLTIDEALDKIKENENFLLSGKLTNSYEKKSILNNPLGKPDKNIAYGNILKPIYKIGVDFLHKRDFLSFKDIFFTLISTILFFSLINIGFLIKRYTLEKEIKKIKNKEKIVYMKYFGGTAVDPILQAKGKVAYIKKSEIKQEDAADILNLIGKIKLRIRNITFTYINITDKSVVIKGIADNIPKIDILRKYLLNNFSKVIIEESIKEENGNIRFTIRAVK